MLICSDSYVAKHRKNYVMDKQTKWVTEQMFSSHNKEKKRENLQILQENHEALKE